MNIEFVYNELSIKINKLDTIRYQDEYHGQPKPHGKPSLFAPDVFSRGPNLHSAPAFSPDGQEVYWTVVEYQPHRQYTMSMKRENNLWTTPTVASSPFDQKFMDSNLSFSPDGRKIYFHSGRPLSSGWKAADSNIFYMESNANGWGEPKPLSPPINTGLELNATESNDGTIYFQSYRGDSSSYQNPDLYYAQLTGSSSWKVVRLPSPVNTEFEEGHPYITPTGNTLFFYSTRPGGKGKSDIYACFKSPKGDWSEPVYLGDEINSNYNDRHPTLTPDGQFLFYLSDRSGKTECYWTDTKFIDKLKTIKISGNEDNSANSCSGSALSCTRCLDRTTTRKECFSPSDPECPKDRADMRKWRKKQYCLIAPFLFLLYLSFGGNNE